MTLLARRLVIKAGGGQKQHSISVFNFSASFEFHASLLICQQIRAIYVQS
jgi:hypothetical protein